MAPDHSLEITPSENRKDDRLEEYYSAGLFLKVLIKRYNIDALFSKATLKQLIGNVDVALEDLSLDPELFKGYQWILYGHTHSNA